MHLTRSVRFLLLLLFALLQCVAPLAHAHVNGNNADQSAHIAIIDSAALAAHDSDAAYFAAEQHPSAVVCMPPESRCSDLAVAQHIAATDKPLLAVGGHVVLSFVAPPRQNLCRSPYQYPRSQAPPA